MNPNEKENNYLIIPKWYGFQAALLLPQNVVCKGEAVSLPFAIAVIDRIQKNNGLLDKANVFAKFGLGQEYALLEYDCANIFINDTSDNALKENTVYMGEVLANTAYATIIGVNGHYGYLTEVCNIEKGNKINVSVIYRPDNKWGFYRFKESVEFFNTNENESNEFSQSIEDFLTKEELVVLDEEQRKKINVLLTHVDGLTRDNINVVRQEIHLSYSPSGQFDLAYFLAENPDYFKEGNFWISCYKDEDLIKLIIFNSQDVVLEVGVNRSGMYVQEFSHSKNKTNAQFLMDKNQNPLIISGARLHFHEGNFIADNYLEVGEAILTQYQVAKSLIPELKAKIRSLKEKAGVEYLTLKEYLNFQENRELEINQKLSVLIAPNQSRISTSDKDGYSTGLEIGIDTSITSLYQSYDTDVCYVNLSRDGEDKPIKAELKLNEDGDGYIIEFYTQHIDIDSWRKSGFEIRRRAGIRHLQLQENAIDNFVYGNRTLDIFTRLNNGELISPEEDKKIVFFDSKFNNVENGNNQPLAIRKAVNNHDIFLIQGPPGTGKTSVIVEIIKQLVINKGERVLVCSQAHSAVKNIFDRIANTDIRLKIGNIDEEETMVADDIQEHPTFLKNNSHLLQLLLERSNESDIEAALKNYELEYTVSAKKTFMNMHKYVCKYFGANILDNPSSILEIIEELRNGLTELGDDANAFNAARHYQELNVVMGTCVGIGMNVGLQRSNIRFDTVIIDEAGKANLSETTVPMQLGKKFILVGDQNQLPPYMDQEDIATFVESSPNLALTKNEVEDAISSSLFKDFLEDENFPEGSKVLLNYQYRMNPEIGNYISELFYNKGLQNGFGTNLQQYNLEGFVNAVTVIDTSSNDNTSYESGNSSEGWYNEKEADIFCDRVLQRLEIAKAMDPELSIGIITPYRQQRTLLSQRLKDSILKNCIYTIDSIQGTEFDIVVLSLVRSFSTKNGKRKVGFLDDMRRLNVALSRAKKKLIIICNLATLCAESAHFESSMTNVKPVEVFRKLYEIHERTAEKTSLEILKDEITNGRLNTGYIFRDCVFHKDVDGRSLAEFVLNGSARKFPIKLSSIDQSLLIEGELIDVKFLCIGNDGRAKFEYLSKYNIAEQVSKGLKFATATPIDWDDDNSSMILRFEDGSESSISVNKVENQKTKGYLTCLLNSIKGEAISLYFPDPDSFLLNNHSYLEFEKLHAIGDKVMVKIIADEINQNYYIVQCGNVYGKIIKRSNLSLTIGQEVKCSIYKSWSTLITFNVI